VKASQTRITASCGWRTLASHRSSTTQRHPKLNSRTQCHLWQHQEK